MVNFQSGAYVVTLVLLFGVTWPLTASLQESLLLCET